MQFGIELNQNQGAYSVWTTEYAALFLLASV